VSLCQPQISHGLARNLALVSLVRGWILTVWAWYGALRANINLHYSICPARWTLGASIIKTSRWILCREIVVVYCKAIFTQVVCWKIIYHLRVITTLWELWSCSFLATCPFPDDSWQMWHPSRESPAFAHLSFRRYLLRSHYTFLSDKEQKKWTDIWVYIIGIIRYVEWPSTQAVGKRFQWPGKDLASVRNTNICQIYQAWEQYDSWLLSSFRVHSNKGVLISP
jgi:hypothetical protein